MGRLHEASSRVVVLLAAPPLTCCTVHCRDYRMANLNARLLVRMRGAAMLFFLGSIIVFFWVRFNSCLTIELARLGFTPMQVLTGRSVHAFPQTCIAARSCRRWSVYPSISLDTHGFALA
jgi:hypothetical protein